MTIPGYGGSDGVQPPGASPRPGPALRPGANFQVSTERRDTSAVVSVAGEVDLVTVASLRAEITECLRTPPSVLVIDLSAVGFLGSAGLSALLDTHRESAPEVDVRIVANQRVVLRTLQLTGVDELLPPFDTVEQALQAG